MLMPPTEPAPDSEVLAPPVSTLVGHPDKLYNHKSFLCSLENTKPTLYCPQVVGGAHLNDVPIPHTFLGLRLEKSAISQDL